MAILGKDLAKHWGCAPSYISKLRRTKDMPEFESLAEADEWKVAVNERPAKGAGNPDGVTKFLKLSPVDWDAVAALGSTDFDELMLEHAEKVPVMAYALYEQAAKAGNDSLASVRVKNWGEAAKQAGLVREKFLALRKESRGLIEVGEVLEIIGGPLQELVGQLAKLDKRLSLKVNPENPELAGEILAGEGDRLIGMVREFLESAEHNIVTRNGELEVEA